MDNTSTEYTWFERLQITSHDVIAELEGKHLHHAEGALTRTTLENLLSIAHRDGSTSQMNGAIKIVHVAHQYYSVFARISE